MGELSPITSIPFLLPLAANPNPCLAKCEAVGAQGLLGQLWDAAPLPLPRVEASRQGRDLSLKFVVTAGCCPPPWRGDEPTSLSRGRSGTKKSRASILGLMDVADF